MPRIPLYQFQPQGSNPQGVRANTGMFDAERAAAARVGQAVAGLGDVAASAMTRLQQANNYKQLAQTDVALQQAWDDFQANLNPSSDETKWVADWQKKADEVITKLAPKDAGPQLKTEFEVRTARFRALTSGDVGQQAKVNGVQKAKVAGMTRVDQLWKNGDAEGAAAELSSMAELGLILPEEVPGMVKKGATRMEIQQATNAIANDPIAAREALEDKTPSGRWKNFTNLEEDDRLTLLNHARSQMTALQSATYQELVDGLNNAEVKTPEQLQAMVERKLITPKQRKSYEAAYRHGGFNTDPEAIGQLLTDIANYDPLKDADSTGRAKLLGRIATTGFPQNVQSQANELLKQKSDPNNPLNSPVAKDAFEAIDQRFKLGLYGKYETRSMITTGPMAGQWTTTVDKGAYEKALATKRRVEDATRLFVEQNPKATAEQVNQFIYGLQESATVKSTRETVMGGLGLTPALPAQADDWKAKKARIDAILGKDTRK